MKKTKIIFNILEIIMNVAIIALLVIELKSHNSEEMSE